MPVTIEQIIKALENSGGFQTVAAKQLGISQPALNKRIKRSKKIQEKLNEIEEAKLDLAESKLMKQLNDGNWQAIKFMMQYKGHKRDYYKKFKQELEGNEDKPVTIVVKHKSNE